MRTIHTSCQIMTTKWEKEEMKNRIEHPFAVQCVMNAIHERLSYETERERLLNACIRTVSVLSSFSSYFPFTLMLSIELPLFLLSIQHTRIHIHSKQARTLSHRSVLLLLVSTYTTQRGPIFSIHRPIHTASQTHGERENKQPDWLTHSLFCSIYRWVYVCSQLQASLCV